MIKALLKGINRMELLTIIEFFIKELTTNKDLEIKERTEYRQFLLTYAQAELNKVTKK